MLTPRELGIIVFHSPCAWNYYPSRLSSSGKTLRLSC